MILIICPISEEMISSTKCSDCEMYTKDREIGIKKCNFPYRVGGELVK